ncbi:MAG: DUF4435 domain-containing protein [Candidatus Methylumidiphilus sp.]
MRQYLNENAKINEIRLELRHPATKNHIWVLVEGETDQKLYAKLLDGCNTKVERVHGGKDEGGGIIPLRTAVDILSKETRQVIGIRDADFLHLDNTQETIRHLFLTDFHDAEMTMLFCDVTFESLVAEYLESKRTECNTLRQQILHAIAFLGVVRWINNIESLGLNFKGINFSAFFDSAFLHIHKHNCIQEIVRRSPHKKRIIQAQEIENRLTTISDYYTLCNGHDFEKAFALHVTANSPSTKGVKDDDIGRALRIAYRKQDFEQTKLYASLKLWERETGYALF